MISSPVVWAVCSDSKAFFPGYSSRYYVVTEKDCIVQYNDVITCDYRTESVLFLFLGDISKICMWLQRSSVMSLPVITVLLLFLLEDMHVATEIVYCSTKVWFIYWVCESMTTARYAGLCPCAYDHRERLWLTGPLVQLVGVQESVLH